MPFPTFRPAIRLVDSVGSVLIGPLRLWQPNAQGVFLRESRIEYAPELLGPYMNLQYAKRWRLLGYRPAVSLDFICLNAETGTAFANLYQYFVGAMASETYAALQFNLYEQTSGVWRGMIPTTPWAPRPCGGKQRVGFELSFGLEARDLISTPGDWTSLTW